MNERIKEVVARSHMQVVEQCGGNVDPNLVAEVFATNLILECVEVAKRAKSLEAAAAIALHFGVK